MKKFTFLFYLMIVSVATLRAQSALVVDQNTFNLQTTVDQREDAIAHVTNNSSTTRTIRWVRIIDNEPSGWTSYVCDKNNCYLFSSSEVFVLDPNSSGLLQLTVDPAGYVGQGQFHMIAYDVNDSANANVVISVTVKADKTTGINDPKPNDVAIYPIPAKEVLNVIYNTSDHVNQITIYNVVGQKLKSVTVTANSKMVSVPVADLKKGVYFLRVSSNGNDIVTRTFTKE